jgi:RHS repeat-associated protein
MGHAGRIVAMNLNGESAQYDYDDTNQLISATYDKLPIEHYEYDLNGNRKNFEIGKNNQLTNDGEFRYTYDDEGNRISKTSLTTGEKTAYNWDHRNRLIGVAIGSGWKKQQVQYRYDYMNRLTHRNDELFVHDGWQVVCSLKNGKIVDRYLWGARQDELLCENDHWTLCDHLGTIREMINENGKTVSCLDYSAFGELLNVSGIKPRFRYTGKMFDDVTQLQWNINRWYDAKVGKWCSKDPIGVEGRDMNLSRYVDNSPIQFHDNLGLWKWEIEGNLHIFTAESQDTFESLLIIIGSFAGVNFTSNNISCIRPYTNGLNQKTIKAMKDAWSGKRPACGGKYNATSLVQALPAYSTGSDLKYSIGTDNNGYINAATQFYGATYVASKTTLITNILEAAAGGSRPIRSLILIGHSNRGSNKIGSNSTNGERFEFEDLGSRSNTPSNAWSWITWSDAINNTKTLPYGCWFSFNAHIRLVGCYTRIMANNAANRFVRQGGWTFGTERQTWYQYNDNNVLTMGWKDGYQLDGFVSTPQEYHSRDRWDSYQGTK